MSELRLIADDFLDAIDPGISVGDSVRFLVSGRVRMLEEELIDVTHIGSPRRFKPGRMTITVVVTNIEADAA